MPGRCPGGDALIAFLSNGARGDIECLAGESEAVRPALVSLAFACAFAAQADAKTVWLCRPGLAHNPCAVSLRTTLFTPAGKKLRVISPKRVRRPNIDCFYVYPTV